MTIKNISKILVLFSVVCFLFLSAWQFVNAEEVQNVWKLRKGTFVKIMTREEISTLTADIEDEVTFLSPQDMYVYETNAIPSGTIFYGEVEDVREPVQGRNGAIKIYVYKMITPDRKVYKIKAHLYSENDNYIGGEQTESIYYHKVPHYIKGFPHILQAAPLNVYEQGRHTIIKPGEEMFLIFDDDVILK